jgi:hypothetical protein
MKTILCSLIVCLSLTAAVAGAGDKAWFDPENCQMCTAMTEHAGLMEHMSWETYVIANGMLSVTTVDPEYMVAYREAHKKMEATGQEMMSGKTMELCGCCTDMGALLMAGAKMEAFPTKGGDVMLVTSGDEALAAKIQVHAETTIREMEKMMGGHEGHEAHGGDGQGH